VHPYRVFTLEQANSAVAEVSRVTSEVQERLDDLRNEHVETEFDASERLEAETRHLLASWQAAVLALGAEPKGIFTVDFRSPDPNVLWCWTVSEPEITHRHFTWESFKDRVEIRGGKRAWPGSN
jgi:hypothetical protein